MHTKGQARSVQGMTMQQTTRGGHGVVLPITLRDRLRIAREFAGLGQAALAEAAGISRGAISNAEGGRSQPTRATLTVWAWACGVDAGWLMTGETPEGPSPSDDGPSASYAPWDSNPEPAVSGLGAWGKRSSFVGLGVAA